MKMVKGSSIMRVFGASYKYKEEAKEMRASMRRGQESRKSKEAPIKSKSSVREISTPFGGMNKRY